MYKKTSLRTFTVYAVLVILSLFAFLLGWLKLINTLMVTTLLVSTFIKGQLIIDYFMDLHQVQLKWRLIPILWLLLVISLIALAYYLPVK